MDFSNKSMISHMTEFCRLLRENGVLVTPQETADAMRAMTLGNLMDRSYVYWSVRSLFVSKFEDIPIFDELFEQFWNFEIKPAKIFTKRNLNQGKGLHNLKQRKSSLFEANSENDTRKENLEIFRKGSSSAFTNTSSNISTIDPEELSEISRIAAKMVRNLEVRLGRRLRRHRRKGIPDLRGAFRLNLSLGGDPIRLHHLTRVLRAPRLLVLMDVSGSMDRYARLLLQLVFAVARHTKNVEAFVFSTTATRITKELKGLSFPAMVAGISESVNHWSAGTRIGESLRAINVGYRTLADRYTVVFLLSDGWESGDPTLLASQMKRLRSRVKKIVWLNPLLGTEGYEPTTRGLQAAMPYVDEFASVKDVPSLKKLPELLRK